MPAGPQILDRVREAILGELHLGHLRAGDRLPSVRELSRQLDADHRAVARSYRSLEAEGLVEVRGRAGVYLARQERVGGELSGETARWLATVLGEARRRRISIPGFPGFVRGYVARTEVRCACIESNQDAGLSLTLEMEEEFGFTTTTVWRREGEDDAADAPPTRAAAVDPVAAADLIVTTAFHRAHARAAAEELGKPLVVVTIAREMSMAIERRLSSGPLTVVVADEAYGERFRSIYRAAARSERDIRVVLAGDRDAIARLERSDPVLATRAARRLLPDLDVPLFLPRYPSISAESARELIELLIRINAERAAP